MDTRKLLSVLCVAERLKDTTRHCYTRNGRHESVAEHSWMTTLMAFFMKDEFPEIDMDKVIRMCIIHDLGEAFTGDIPAFEKTSANERTEEDRLLQWVGTLPEPYKSELVPAPFLRLCSLEYLPPSIHTGSMGIEPEKQKEPDI